MDWTTIITIGIVAFATLWAGKKAYDTLKPKEISEDDCLPCSTGSCSGCAVADLKKDIENNKLN